jgi:hypothetical protein
MFSLAVITLAVATIPGCVILWSVLRVSGQISQKEYYPEDWP